MKIARWRNPQVSLECVALKLCEEVGEVAKEIAYAGNPEYGPKPLNVKAVLIELDHVEALAAEIRRRVVK